jgi:mutator protein MutT
MSDTEVVRVLAAVVQRDGRYLVCLRPPHKRHGGLWEFPGGKLEPNETPEGAAVRELREELGVDVTAFGSLLYTHQEPNAPFRIEFLAVEISGEPLALEHTSLQWATPSELGAMPLAPSDQAFAVTLGT